METLPFTLAGAALRACPSGALWWPEARLLAVADLHLARSERLARRSGQLLPPYEGRETLGRLAADLEATGAATVICLGDSFDDDAAARALGAEDRAALEVLARGRRWVWVAGNHDPAPPGLPGLVCAALAAGPLLFRHEAEAGAAAEVSGHFHPKLRLALGGASVARPCFLADAARVILPAYGAYTGGLDARAAPLAGLMGPQARAFLLPRGAGALVAVPLALPAAAPARPAPLARLPRHGGRT